PIERGELSWYLEHYFVWPVGVFKERGAAVEAQLPEWGKLLYNAAMAVDSARELGETWRRATGAEKRFSIEVDEEALEGATEAKKNAAQEAAAELLALPWELLHDGAGYLFQGAQPAQVRRRLPNRQSQPDAPPLNLPIRVLLVSPRPEQEGTGYIDHRASAAPLAGALAELGDLAELTVLAPPTFQAMQDALLQAREAEKNFHVLHFDGHGVYDRRRGLGALCFEDPADADKLHERRTALVHADELAAALRDYRIPLVFLEACQSAQSEASIEASVAGSLLQKGVTSVVAMSHSVLVETARRFTGAFYAELAHGARVGQAMLAGQHALHGDPVRGRISAGPGELRLLDWFVPVLYQEQHDPRLFRQLLPAAAQRLTEQHRRLSLGALPKPPPHHFVGRSRELLALERLLPKQSYAVLRGQGGAGKTALACELARWLVITGRFQRAVFLTLEEAPNQRALLDAIGQQLLPKWSVAEQELEKSLQQVQRALTDARTLIVMDNCESVLEKKPARSYQGQAWQDLAGLCRDFLDAAPDTVKLLFTSHERLPEPFAANTIELGPLSRGDALQLLSQVLEQRGLPLPPPAAYDRAERDLTRLVESLNRHARALVLLAPELARRGICEVSDAAREILAELDKKHPGERENSLYASIELSLRRLPDNFRNLAAGLGVFHGGAHLFVMGQVLEVDKSTVSRLASALIETGLAEDAGYGHLRLDPALPVYARSLERQRPEGRAPDLEVRHAVAMQQLLGSLYEQQFKDAQQAAQLTLLELPNLLALLRRRAGELATGDFSPQQAIDMASSLEGLLANLGRPQALVEAVALRQQAAALLEQQGEAWSHAHFLQTSSHIDRLLQQGDLQQAFQSAQTLLQNCLQAGDAAYAGAAYDTAMAHIILGRVLKTGGAAQAALEPLTKAQQRFEALAREGNQSAARMAAKCLTESGDCLTDLGRLDAAARAYEEAIALMEKRDNQRDVAANKFQLGTVRLYQKNYPAALDAYREARDIFTALGEPGSVAIAWHQSGMVYKEMRQWNEAERAYRESMKLEVQQGNRAGEASSLNQLGNLYSDQGRLEEAVNFYRQAADIYTQLGDKRYEGVIRSNIGNQLIKLRRYAEARRELLRAIECKQKYGHTAEPWKTWIILHNLEKAEGNPEAAAQARARGVAAYLAYRRDGGENQEHDAELCAAVHQAIQQGGNAELERQLDELAQQDDWKVFIPKLKAVLHGSRDSALADDPALMFRNAAELMLLL
ncbi:MAG: tetratricopeptide repeat protein, partial [Bradyrhizobium sp.]|nr:tetratricopeptide repeat protein [Bradyrhizobium sp.]